MVFLFCFSFLTDLASLLVRLVIITDISHRRIVEFRNNQKAEEHLPL